MLFFLLTIQEFKVGDRSGMWTIFYVFKMDYSLYTYFFLLTIEEFKVGDRLGISTIFCV